jgi:hypothetical protein
MVRRPQLNVAVCGDRLADADKTKPFEPYHTPRLCELDLADGAPPLAVGVDFALTLQTRQPYPAERAVNFRFSRPQYQLSKTTHDGAKPLRCASLSIC